MIELTDFVKVSEFKTSEGLSDLTPKQWSNYRKENNLATKNISGVWYVISSEHLPESESIVESELVDEVPTGKLSVVSFGGLAIGSHSKIERVEVKHHTFNLASMHDELGSFNDQIDAVDNLLDEATKLLQSKAVEIELGVQQKRQKLSDLDDKILQTKTHAKILRDKVITHTIESSALDEEFVGKQSVLTDVVSEVQSLLS